MTTRELLHVLHGLSGLRIVSATVAYELVNLFARGPQGTGTPSTAVGDKGLNER